METPDRTEAGVPRELPIVAGHLALDFANTVDDPLGPARFDHIASYAGLLHWSVRTGILTPGQAGQLDHEGTRSADGAAAALASARVLREALNRAFTPIATGSGSAVPAWDELRPFVAGAVTRARLVPTATGHTWAWPGTRATDGVDVGGTDVDGTDVGARDLEVMLWPVAHAAAGLLTGGDLDRIKQCAGCPWLFLDQSRNGSRRWCSMDDCGTHQKITRYVARRAQRRATRTPAGSDPSSRRR